MVVNEGFVSDPVFDGLRLHFTIAKIVEIVALVGVDVLVTPRGVI